VFAFFNVDNTLYQLRHCRGLAGIVCAGVEPCEVSSAIIDQLKHREKDGVVVLNEPELHPLQRVSIVEGPLRGVEAIFERYLKGAERVAVLLNSVRGGNLRVVLSSAALAPADAY
jgi:transcription antitermination factor NusG